MTRIADTEVAKRYRVPSVRQRYVTRARYLTESPPFKSDIQRARAAWDAAFPAFAIGAPSVPPERPAFLDENPLFVGIWEPAYPPRMEAGYRAERLSIEGTGPHPPHDQGWWEASLGWRHLLDRLCEKWWPQRWYPLPGRGGRHPARPFVTACLLWTPLHARAEWVARPVLGVTPLLAPIDEMSPPQAIEWWRVRYETIVRHLVDAVTTGQVISADFVDRLIRLADATAHDAEMAKRDEVEGRCLPDGPLLAGGRCVTVFPGLTREDWRGAEALVLEQLRGVDGHPVLRDEARLLHTEGRSNREIAGLLGLSRSTVRTWTQSP